MIFYASNNTNGVNSGSQQNSICPKGWTLPINGQYGELNNLYNNGITGSGLPQGSDKGLFNAPLYIVWAGYVDDGSLNRTGNDGDYWSNTVGSSSNAYYLNFTSTDVYPADYRSRWDGFSVRCVTHWP